MNIVDQQRELDRAHRDRNKTKASSAGNKAIQRVVLREIPGKPEWLYPRIYAHRRFVEKSNFHAFAYGFMASTISISASVFVTIFLMALVDIRMVLHGGGLGVAILSFIQFPFIMMRLFPYMENILSKMWGERHDR